MRIYGHDKSQALKSSEGKPTELLFPSGKNHVLLPNGQHVNHHRRHESKKDRLKRRHAEADKRASFQPVSFPLVQVPPTGD